MMHIRPALAALAIACAIGTAAHAQVVVRCYPWQVAFKGVFGRLCEEAPFRHRRAYELAAPRTADPAGTSLRLFLEPRHDARISPTGARQIGVVLVAVFLEPTPHVTMRLVPAECSGAGHRSISLKRALPARV